MAGLQRRNLFGMIADELLLGRLELLDAALQIGEIMAQSEYPMGLIDLELDDQVWANTALANLKGTSLEECRQENVRRLWQEEALAEIKRALTHQQEFLQRYEADLNPGDTRKFHSRFQLVLDGRYRLTSLYEWEPLMEAASV